MAEEDIIEKLKKLSPKERIGKLKEIQEKNKEEIEKAQDLIKESEEQAARDEEIEKIPVPQLKAVDIGALFSPEERELFRAKRFETEKPKKAEETGEEKGELETIAERAPRLPPEAEQEHIQYVRQLSQTPTEQLYNRAKELYSEFKTQGNQFTPEQ